MLSDGGLKGQLAELAAAGKSVDFLAEIRQKFAPPTVVQRLIEAASLGPGLFLDGVFYGPNLI
jgi:hypothetical protein